MIIFSGLIELTGATKPENMKLKLLVEASQRVDDFFKGRYFLYNTVLDTAKRYEDLGKIHGHRQRTGQSRIITTT